MSHGAPQPGAAGCESEADDADEGAEEGGEDDHHVGVNGDVDGLVELGRGGLEESCR